MNRSFDWSIFLPWSTGNTVSSGCQWKWHLAVTFASVVISTLVLYWEDRRIRQVEMQVKNRKRKRSRENSFNGIML